MSLTITGGWNTVSSDNPSQTRGLAVNKTAVGPSATGVVANLKSTFGGTLTFAKVSGDAKVAIASNGDVSLSSALGAGGSATFIARVTSSNGKSRDRTITVTAQAFGQIKVAQVWSVIEGTGVGGVVRAVIQRDYSKGTASVTASIAGYGPNPVDAADFGGSFPTQVVNFADGEARKVINFTVNPDTTAEANEQGSITLSSATTGYTVSSPAPFYVMNDDAAVIPQIGPSSVSSVLSSGTPGDIIATLTNIPAGSVPQVRPNDGRVVVSGNELAGWFLVRGTANLRPGNINLRITADAVRAREITVSVSASDTISVSNLTTVTEGNSGTVNISATFTRTNSTGSASATYTLSGDGLNPANAADFGGSFPTGTVSFVAGQITKTQIVGMVAGDLAEELNEGIKITLSNPSTGYQIGTATSSAVIVNDDSALPPVFAALTKVPSTLLATNAAETQWSTQSAISPDGLWALQGSTDNTGLQYIGLIRVSDRAVMDVRRIESPRFFTADEHNSVAVAWLPNGGFVFSVIGHSNAVVETIANQGRVLVGYSTDYNLDNIQTLAVYTMPSTSSAVGANYAQWAVYSNTEFVLWSNNDSLVSWLQLRFTDGNYQNGIWQRSVAKNARPAGGDGQNQLYMIRTPMGGGIDRLYFQPHPSNTRNIIRYLDLNVATGDVTASGASIGNMYSGSATMYSFSTDTTATIVFDPGAGKSFRLTDAVGAGIGGVHFVSADGSGARHIWVEGGVTYDLGPAGSYFGTVFPGAYYGNVVRAREAHTGYRFYRTFNDGAGNWSLERLDMTTLGGTISRTPLDTSVEPTKILRVFPFTNAAANLAISYVKGTYTSYTGFSTGMVFSDGGFAPAISFSVPDHTVGESSGAVSSTLNVVRNGVVGDIVINLARTGTAVSGVDYTPGATSVTIPSGQNSVTYTSVTVIDDVGIESSETVIETATIAAYPSVTTTKTITIVDNDTVGGTLFYEDTFTEASTTALSAHTADLGSGYTTIIGGTINVSSAGRLIIGNTNNSVSQQTTACPTSKVRAIANIVQGSDNDNAVGFGLRCTNGAYEGYYFMANTSSNLLQILRVVAGTAQVIGTVTRTWIDGDTLEALIDTANIAGGDKAIISVKINGTAQAITLSGVANTSLQNSNMEIVDGNSLLTGNRVHVRTNTNPTTASTGTTLDRIRAYSY